MNFLKDFVLFIHASKRGILMFVEPQWSNWHYIMVMVPINEGAYISNHVTQLFV